MRFAHAAPGAALIALAAVSLAAGCTNADLPAPSSQLATSGSPWAAEADAACADVAAGQTRPTGGGSGVGVLTWHQDVAYLLASRLQAVPDGGADAQQFVGALHDVGASTEALVTALSAKPVDATARQKADAERTAAIGKAAALSAKLGLAACTPLVAGATG